MKGGSSLYITIPCGKCVECKQQIQNEFSVRVYYEAKKCVDSNGYFVFETFTYGPENSHYLSDYYNGIDKGSDFDLLCFDKEDIVKFLKRLRKNISSRYDYNASNTMQNTNIKYCIVSEYGGDKHRPHYHSLFFVYPDENGKIISKEDFVCELNKCWKLGITSLWNKKHGCLVRGYDKYIFDKVHIAVKGNRS